MGQTASFDADCDFVSAEQDIKIEYKLSRAGVDIKENCYLTLSLLKPIHGFYTVSDPLIADGKSISYSGFTSTLVNPSKIVIGYDEKEVANSLKYKPQIYYLIHDNNKFYLFRREDSHFMSTTNVVSVIEVLNDITIVLKKV